MRKSFEDQVYRFVTTVPAGKVVTYGQVAEAIGHPGAARAVGTALKHNQHPWRMPRSGQKSRGLIPCHRVVQADGKIGEYNGGESMKRKLLLRENIQITKGRVASGNFLFT